MGLGKDATFSRLIISNFAHFCDEDGKFVSIEKLSEPSFKPWIRYAASMADDDDTLYLYWLIYQPLNAKLFLIRLGKKNEQRRHIKCDTQLYKFLTAKLDRIHPQVALWTGSQGSAGSNSPTMGYQGTNILSTGYIFAPYIPIYHSPKIPAGTFNIKVKRIK